MTAALHLTSHHMPTALGYMRVVALQNIIISRVKAQANTLAFHEQLGTVRQAAVAAKGGIKYIPLIEVVTPI